MPDIERAIHIAVQAHAGQKDKSGAPYILHPLRCMMRCTTPEARMAAVLHDVVEDTAVTHEQLATEGFPPAVLAALRLLTHDEEVPYDTYIDSILTNPLAIEVKLADLEDNSDTTRLQVLDDRAVERLKKYHAARRRLAAARLAG